MRRCNSTHGRRKGGSCHSKNAIFIICSVRSMLSLFQSGFLPYSMVSIKDRMIKEWITQWQANENMATYWHNDFLHGVKDVGPRPIY